MRKSPQTTLVFSTLLGASQGWSYGYDVSRNTGLKSGTLYPILMRLAERGLLETTWETVTGASGRPPRHLYRLTQVGLRYAQEQVSAAVAEAASKQVGLPAWSEVTG